jgi:hypothetical protein
MNVDIYGMNIILALQLISIGEMTELE